MKKKLLLFLLFHLLFGFTLSSKNLNDLEKFHNVNFVLSSKSILTDTIKKIKKTSRNSKTKATLAPPITTAGSSCGDGVALMQVNVYAFGANGSEIIEWFASQSSATPIYTGSVYSPSISSTKTYYVRSRSGGDVSTRVPVVASIYVVPPAVTLTASPQNNTSSPLCFGTTVTFTASGGADLFEFSVDGVVMQGMSTSRVFTTNTLSDGQVVKVRTRYAVVLDGSITEMAWGTGVLEDNFLSAALSVNASTGYVNSFKISALEDKVVLGIAGKVLSNRSILLFLDTKSGGFNVSDFGNEADNDPAVKAFNMFNNSSSTFDSYFLADYCLVISTDATSTNYYANVIELKSGVSVKTFLGSTASGFPSAVMGVDKNNTGINDYSRGFEVEVLKSLLGYTTGDIKFFALTMNDKEDGSQSVTNSFLSPERSSNLDYGKAAIDYNFKDPNPVVVASAALIPCYSESNITMNFVSTPSVSSITQPTCAVQTGTIYITAQPGVYYSIDGTVYQNSNMFSGLLPGNYNLFVKKISDNTCALSSAIPAVINAIPTPPVVPTAANVVQPTCGGPSGSIVITTQTGTEYSLNGTTYQVSNTFSGLTPGNYTMFVRNTADTICVISSESAIIINAIPTPPAVPTSLNVTQPTCGAPSGSISIITQSGVEYSLNGTTYQSSNTFPGLAPNNYTLYVRNTADNICVTPSSGAITINAIPTPPVVPTTDSVIQPTCATPSGSILITTQTGVEYSLNGTMYQSSNTFSGLAPNNYTLYVRSTGDNTCLKSSATMTTINAVPTPPVVATTASVVQPTCATPSGSISITTQTGVVYSLNGTTYQSSNTFSGLAPNNYTLYVRNTADNTCSIQSTASVTVNPLPLLPSTPTLVRVTQPTCFVPSGSIEIATQADVQYSVGSGYQNSAVFNNLAPGKYTISVRFTNSITCITLGSETIINAIPPQIQFETIADCENKEYTLTANPLLRSYDPNNVSYQWKDKVGNIVGTNSNVLNVTDVIALKPSGQVVFPVTYTLTVSSLNTGCETSSDVIVESVYCNIQKGISPDGNGSNDFFDLRLMNVKKLEIFNRYGVKVYSQNNYSDQWNGQTSKGEDLPSATYYYVIEFNSGEPKTGWIYLIREKH